MLSISNAVATSSPLSLSVIWSKKLVGGNCWVSPITTAVFPLMNAPKASSGFTWLASSKITTSNCNLGFVGSRYCAIDNGLIINTGLIFLMVPPAFSRRVLTGKWPLFLVNSPANILASGSFAAPYILGIWLLSLLNILFLLRLIIFLSKSLNSFIRFSCSSPMNVANASFSLKTILSRLSAKLPYTKGFTSSFLMFLFSIVLMNNEAGEFIQAFLVLEYCDHKCKLDNWPFHLFNCNSHLSKGTSSVSLLNMILLLGFNLDSNLFRFS